jgi:hypothetical protein
MPRAPCEICTSFGKKIDMPIAEISGPACVTRATAGRLHHPAVNRGKEHRCQQNERERNMGTADRAQHQKGDDRDEISPWAKLIMPMMPYTIV